MTRKSSLTYLILIVLAVFCFFFLTAAVSSAQALSSPLQEAPPGTLSVDLLVMVAAALLSLAFSYIPGIATQYQSLSQEQKSLIMAALLLLISVAVFGLSCVGWLEKLWPGLGVTCTQDSAFMLLRLLILAIIANQSIYQLSPQVFKPKDAAQPK